MYNQNNNYAVIYVITGNKAQHTCNLDFDKNENNNKNSDSEKDDNDIKESKNINSDILIKSFILNNIENH